METPTRPSNLETHSNRAWALYTAHELISGKVAEPVDLLNLARVCLETVARPAEEGQPA